MYRHLSIPTTLLAGPIAALALGASVASAATMTPTTAIIPSKVTCGQFLKSSGSERERLFAYVDAFVVQKNPDYYLDQEWLRASSETIASECAAQKGAMLWTLLEPMQEKAHGSK